jgi:protease IV
VGFPATRRRTYRRSSIKARGRNLSEDYVRSIADGRVYTGSDAKDIGLVDELGGLYDAVNVATELAGLKGKPEIIYLNEPGSKKPLPDDV